jgi:antirestriction protein
MKAATANKINQEFKINEVMHACQCDEATAREYLIAEEWIVHDAIVTLKGDRRMAAAKAARAI